MAWDHRSDSTRGDQWGIWEEFLKLRARLQEISNEEGCLEDVGKSHKLHSLMERIDATMRTAAARQPIFREAVARFYAEAINITTRQGHQARSEGVREKADREGQLQWPDQSGLAEVHLDGQRC
jgi:hypothetical protein